MRDTKFRGLTINGDLVIGNISIIKKPLIGMHSVGIGTYISNEAGMPFAYEVRPETVGQYTGLKDMKQTKEFPNGQEIYEGDIFMNGQSPRIIEIRGGNTHAITLDRKQSILLSFIIKSNPKNKVVGNIHENPELL